MLSTQSCQMLHTLMSANIYLNIFATRLTHRVCGSGDVARVNRTTPAEICKAALEAGGLSVNCGGYLPSHLEAAVKDGTVSEETLDAALTRTWEASISLGNFDTPNEQCVVLHLSTSPGMALFNPKMNM